ncbi:MAG: PAS domain-containing protein, partial [Bacillota bacterium]
MTKSKLEIDMNIRERFEQMAHSLDKGFDETLAYLMESFSSQASEIKNITAELNTYKERELEAFLIGDALNDGIYIVDAKGIVIAVNKVFSQLTGIKEEEIIGQPIEYMSQQQLVKKPIGRVVL